MAIGYRVDTCFICVGKDFLRSLNVGSKDASMTLFFDTSP